MEERRFGLDRYVKLIRFVLGACVLVIVCLIVGLPTSTLAAPLAPPVLPPRPTPRATPTAQASLPGASIALRVLSAPTGLWTKVQWQDGWGDWHDVEGWQGTLDTADEKVWWVAPKDFGGGPYRWAIYASRDGPSLGASDPFYLPEADGLSVRVSISASFEAPDQAGPEVGGRRRHRSPAASRRHSATIHKPSNRAAVGAGWPSGSAGHAVVHGQLSPRTLGR